MPSDTRLIAQEVVGGGPRPGQAECECHFGPSPVHNGRDDCPRYGTMHDGWFICGRCVRHAPQLPKGVRWASHAE
jgi:hypothetical protein